MRIDGLAQDCSNSIANTLELLQSCTKPSKSQIAKFMEPTWGPPGSCRPQMGPMLASWTLLSGICFDVFIRTIVNCYSVPLYLYPLSHTIMPHLYKLPHILWGQWAQCLYSMNNTVLCHNNIYHCGIVEVGIQICLNFIWSLYGGGVAEAVVYCQNTCSAVLL